MVTLQRWSVVALLGVLLVSLTGCDPETEGNPILPGQQSYFTVTFEPNPVYEGYDNEYLFIVRITESNGVGASISSIKIEYVQDGGVVETDTWDRREVIRELGTNRLDAYGTIRSQITLSDCYFCDRQNWVVRADDDLGNYVQYSGSVELISR